MDNFLNCFILLLLISISCKGLKDNATSYNNCLTWKDTKSALFLTCRVENFHEPVIFSHADSNTTVKCYIEDENRYCLPEEKKITMNKSDSSVTIVLEVEKALNNQDGEWRCIQGESVQTTEVSLSKGIIIDSWVELRGIGSHLDNKTKHITLECSSCRKPQGLYAEFFAGGKTIGSVHQDNKGRCIHERKLCLPNACSCTRIANAFQFQVRIEYSEPFTNYSCEMQFSDTLRKGKFSITPSQLYMGKDFAVTENKTDIIKNNSVNSYDRPHSDTVPSVTPETDGDKLTSTTDSNKNRSRQREDCTGVTVLLILFVCISVCETSVFVVLIYYKYQYKKKKSDPWSTLSLSVSGNREEHQSNETSLLVSNREDQNCSPCSKLGDTTPADILCFDCSLYYCENCFSFHQLGAFLKRHSHVESKLVPKSFSISIFNCSCGANDNELVTYFCKKHKKLICVKCKTSTHLKCQTKPLLLNEDQFEQLNEKMKKLLNEKKSVEDMLDSIKTFLCHSMLRFKVKHAVVSDTITRTFNENNFHIETDDRRTEGKKDKNQSEKTVSVLHELQEIEERYLSDANAILDYISKWCADLEDQNEVYKFLSTNGGAKYLMITGYYFRMQISEIKKGLNEVQQRCYKLKLKLETEKERIVVKRSLMRQPDILFGKNKTTSARTSPNEQDDSKANDQFQIICAMPDEAKLD